MGLNSDKTSKVFCINICCFSIRFYFFVPQWHNHPSFIKIVDVADLYTPQNQNVHCAVSSNDQYQGNGFAADVFLGPKGCPNRSHRKKSYSISNIGYMMGCDHPSCVPVGPVGRRVTALRIFSNNDRPPF